MLYYERFNSAQEILTKIITANPNNEDAWYVLTQTFLDQNKVKSADSLLKTVPAAIQQNPQIKIATGEVMLLNGDKDGAAKLFEEAIGASKKRDQYAAMLKVAKAHVNAKDGDANEALRLIALVEPKEKKNAHVFMIKGDANRKLALGGEAIVAYKTALEIDESLAKAYHMIGKIYLSQDNAGAYVDNFKDAVALDPAYRPSLHELYYYYYFRDVNRSKEYLEKLKDVSDPSPAYDYMLADLLYVSGKHDEAIQRAQEIQAASGPDAEPRLYKLMAYSYEAKKDSIKARSLMEEYFQKQPVEGTISKDHEFMGKLLLQVEGEEADGVEHLVKAVEMDTAAIEKNKYISAIANYYKKINDRSNEAYWLGEAFRLNVDTSNTKLYEWGLAHFMAKEYNEADTIFGNYIQKYPDQVYGYFWRARCCAALDPEMAAGLAVPYYDKLTEVAGADTVQNKGLLIQAYGYLAAYNANTIKDYAKAVEFLEEILVLEPENTQARTNKEILEKLVNPAGKQEAEARTKENTK